MTRKECMYLVCCEQKFIEDFNTISFDESIKTRFGLKLSFDRFVKALNGVLLTD